MNQISLKILAVLTKKILKKYKPVIIFVCGKSNRENTKERIYKVLEKKHKVLCSDSKIKTYESVILSVLGMKKNEKEPFLDFISCFIAFIEKSIFTSDYPEMLILDINIEKPNEVKKILGIVKADICVLTGVKSSSSSENKTYFSNKAQEEKEIFALIKSLGKKDLAILNSDDEFTAKSLENVKSKVVTYGFNKNADFTADVVFSKDNTKEENEKNIISFKISHKGTTIPFRISNAAKKDCVYSVLSAAAIGVSLGFNLVEISEIISSDKNK